MREIVIDDASKNQRFDKFLKKYFKEAPPSFIYKMLRKKNITLNNKKDLGSTILKEGDIVSVYFSDDTFHKMRGLDSIIRTYEYCKSLGLTIDVLYEDNDIVAVNKPAGVLSQKSMDSDISINEYITSYLIGQGKLPLDDYMKFAPCVVNRLDYNTTGVILIAKTLSGSQYLSQGLKDRTIDKYYICIVSGIVSDTMILEGSLSKDESTNTVTIDSAAKINAKTEVTPIAAGNDTSLLMIHLITGKTHQIRSHMKSIGHPIIGDMKYGNKTDNARYQKKYAVSSQLLHSYKTIIDGHAIIAPVPDIMQRVIEEEYGDVELQGT